MNRKPTPDEIFKIYLDLTGDPDPRIMLGRRLWVKTCDFFPAIKERFRGYKLETYHEMLEEMLRSYRDWNGYVVTLRPGITVGACTKYKRDRDTIYKGYKFITIRKKEATKPLIKLVEEDRRKIPWSVRGKPKMSKGTCKICGAEFERNSGAQKYCKECRVPNEHYRKFLERLDPSAFLEYSEKERASCREYDQLYKTTETLSYSEKSEECSECGECGFRYYWRRVNKRTGWKGGIEVSIVHIRRGPDGKRGVGYSCYLGKKDDI